MTQVPPSLEAAPVPPAPAGGAQGEDTTFVPLLNPREQVRTRIALWLLATVVLLTLGSASALMSGAISPDAFKELVATLLAPILGVFGTVTGFYYGTHASERRGGDPSSGDEG